MRWRGSLGKQKPQSEAPGLRDTPSWLPWVAGRRGRVGCHPTFSRHGIAQSLSALALLIWLNEKVGFHSTFSRHGIAQILSALALLIWLNEKVGFHPTFSRHGIAQSLSALALLIWLNEKVGCQKGGSGRDASITRWQNAGRRLGPTRVWGVPCSPAPRATPCSGR